jgi:hypothetical protein
VAAAAAVVLPAVKPILSPWGEDWHAEDAVVFLTLYKYE